MALSLKLDAFEGPMHLLLHLIEKNKVSIYDIPIVEIANQYIQFLQNLEKDDLNTMSEFLVMASTLLDIKSRMLLPKEDQDMEEESDPRIELVEQLLEYKAFKEVSIELKKRHSASDKVFFKEPTIPDEVKSYEPPVDLNKVIADLTLEKLNEIFNQVLKKQSGKVDIIRAGFSRIEKDEVTTDEKIEEILGYTSKHKNFSFRKFLTLQPGRWHLIVSFLAILELMKTGKIKAVQEQVFDDILILAG